MAKALQLTIFEFRANFLARKVELLRSQKTIEVFVELHEIFFLAYLAELQVCEEPLRKYQLKLIGPSQNLVLLNIWQCKAF